jgi:hypothetical protein
MARYKAIYSQRLRRLGFSSSSSSMITSSVTTKLRFTGVLDLGGDLRGFLGGPLGLNLYASDRKTSLCKDCPTFLFVFREDDEGDADGFKGEPTPPRCLRLD